MQERKPLIKSFNYAIDGIIHTVRSQRNMRIHFLAAALVLVASLLLDIGRVEFLVLLFAITLVLVCELLNSSIEAAIDITTTTYDPLAKIAKDVAAGAVLIAALNALIVGYFVFFYKLNRYTLTAITRVKQSPSHLTLIALLMVLLITIAMKAWIREGSFLKGGWPSGHAALAAAIFTAIALLSLRPEVATLGLLLALLVFHSRIESGVHSLMQVLAGATIGILVTVLVFQLYRVAF